MSDPGGIGGAANELGSRHRAGAAAYLAVLGLAERPLFGRTGEVPEAISLEAAEAVDDIVCEMANGTRWFIQSKRTAGMDSNLRAAARQWARQELAADDRVVLLSNRLRGGLARLQDEIERSLRGDPISIGAQNDLDRFVNILKEEGAEDPRALLRRIQLVQWQVDQAGDADLEAGVAKLANSFVRHDQAPQAFEVLRQRMQLAAGRRETTTAREWVSCLREAGLELFADGTGTRGAKEVARQLAIESHRATLATRKDRLDLSALVRDVPEVTVEDALRDWQVSWPTGDDGRPLQTDVMHVVRATPRVIVAGLPGMGKSELMRQVAARVADEAHAPVPILIDLRHIAAQVRSPTDITLDLLLDRPSRSVTGLDPGVLKAALTNAVISGDAILLVDGLDEAQRARGQVAFGLAGLLEQLPLATGLILTTRESALIAAGRLELPVVRLETPGTLPRAMEALLGALAPSGASSATPDWVAIKTEELRAMMTEHGDIWNVPLLATLATVRLASGHSTTTSVPVLLNQVIEDSVKEWELRRAEGMDELSRSLEPDMLLAGFAALGHELVSAASIPVEEGRAAVRESLHEWGLARPLQNLIADQIVAFWDERVGVFVDSGGDLVPRSRQFAELGEIRWLKSRDEESRRKWLARAVGDELYENAVSLASSMDPVVRRELIHAASREGDEASRGRAGSWLAQQWSSWPHDAEQQLTIVDVLADAAEDGLSQTLAGSRLTKSFRARQQRTDGGGWEFVLSLVAAPRTPELDSRRKERLGSLPLAPERRTIVTALAGLIDAEAERRPLDQEALAAVLEIIRAPKPKKPEPFYNDDGVLVLATSSPGVVTGVGEVAERSIEFLEQLGPDDADNLHAIARRQSVRRFGRMGRRLLELGYTDPEPWWTGVNIPDDWTDLTRDHGGLGWLLRILECRAPTGTEEPLCSWRYAELGRFFAALGYADSSIGGFSLAATEDAEVLQAWVSAHIEAFALDSERLANEARQLLGAEDAEEARDSVIHGRLQPDEMPSGIDEATALALVPAFQSNSEWIVHSAFRLLLQTRYASVAEALSELSGSQSWNSAFEKSVAIIANSPDPEASVVSMAESDSPAVRAALGAVLQAGQVDAQPLLDRLRLDPDGAVRHYAGGDPRSADSWACTRCGVANDPDRTACLRCHATALWR